MIFSFKIIAQSGIQIFEHIFRDYREATDYDESPLISGFFSAFTNIVDHAFSDEMKEIFLGASKFQTVRRNSLLFILHTDMLYPSFVGIIKLKKLVETFFLFYDQKKTSSNLLKVSEFSLFHKKVNWIIEENSSETELIYEVLLAGSKVKYSNLFNKISHKVLFSVCNCNDREKQFFLEKLAIFQTSTSLLQSFEDKPESQNKLKHLLLRIEKYWLLVVEYKNLFLFTTFNESDGSHLVEIVTGAFDKMISETLDPFSEASRQFRKQV